MFAAFIDDACTSKDKGLTLVEMVVVCMLLAMMGSILYTSLSGIGSAKEAIQAQRQTARTARFVLGRISRELRGALAEPLYIQQDENESAQRRSNPFLEGINSKKGSSSSDAIQFVSSSGAQAVYGALSNYGHVQIRYRLVENPDEKQLSLDHHRYLLTREETPAGVDDEDLLDKRRIVFPLANNISAMNFRYFQDGEWKNSWTDEDSGLPEAVEISLLIMGPNGSLDSYRTAVAVAPKQGQSRTGTRAFPGFNPGR